MKFVAKGEAGFHIGDGLAAGMIAVRAARIQASGVPVLGDA
jgi:glutamate synthase domain-containing protein 3